MRLHQLALAAAAAAALPPVHAVEIGTDGVSLLGRGVRHPLA